MTVRKVLVTGSEGISDWVRKVLVTVRKVLVTVRKVLVTVRKVLVTGSGRY